MELISDCIDSPIGKISVVCNGQALCALDFEDFEARKMKLLKRYYGEVELRPSKNPAGVCDALSAYLEGEYGAIDEIEVAAPGSEFQQKVWRALRQIPSGQTWSYGELAKEIGQPKASRAVGLANGSNPIAIVVPCHRVIGANGTLTGYGGGLERKRWLLAHEGALLL